MQCMDFREIGRLVSEDRISLEYLWKNHEEVHSTYCSSRDFYYLGRSRVRCKQCGRDIYPLKGTRFSLLRITPSQWLSLIKLFELSVSAITSTKKLMSGVFLTKEIKKWLVNKNRKVLMKEILPQEVMTRRRG